MKIKNILALTSALFLVLFSSCDLFSTRDVEDPTESKTNLPPAFSLEELIKNFGDSYLIKSPSDYLNNFSDTISSEREFRFIASSEAASQYPSLNEWDLRSEESYFRNLIAFLQNNTVSLSLTNSSFSQQGDSLIYSSSYTLTVPFNNQDMPQNYRGELVFYVRPDNSNIRRIYYWQDFKSGDLPSWSELKGRLAP